MELPVRESPGCLGKRVDITLIIAHNTPMELLQREQILAALDALNTHLEKMGLHAQLNIIGGTVMCLVYQARASTRDVDAWFTEAGAVRKAASLVASDLELPEDWLNDAAKAFIPSNAKFERWRSFSNLDILVADAHSLLAMKCAAARSTEDAEDIRFLANFLGLRSEQEVMDVVLLYYPIDRLTIRVQLLLEEIFDDGA